MEIPKHPDQERREKIPKRSDLPTQYQPLMDLVMIVPIPDITKVGSIELPSKSIIQANEGHVVGKGPLCSKAIDIGDCVLFDEHSEMRLSTDDDKAKFVLVRESNISMKIPFDTLDKSAGRESKKQYKKQHTPVYLRRPNDEV